MEGNETQHSAARKPLPRTIARSQTERQTFSMPLSRSSTVNLTYSPLTFLIFLWFQTIMSCWGKVGRGKRQTGANTWGRQGGGTTCRRECVRGARWGNNIQEGVCEGCKVGERHTGGSV